MSFFSADGNKKNPLLARPDRYVFKTFFISTTYSKKKKRGKGGKKSLSGVTDPNPRILLFALSCEFRSCEGGKGLSGGEETEGGTGIRGRVQKLQLPLVFSPDAALTPKQGGGEGKKGKRLWMGGGDR